MASRIALILSAVLAAFAIQSPRLAASGAQLVDDHYGPVVISEFVARNATGLVDADGDTSDWIELHNTSASALALSGWSLVDSNDRWNLPDQSLAPNSYLVIFASGKDRIGAELHTSFKLAGDGEPLSLIDPGGRVASSYLPTFPPQVPDLSYGISSSGAIGYFSRPTPGETNGAATSAGKTAPPTAAVGRSIQRGAFVETVTSATPNATIYYTLDGTEPTTASSIAAQGRVSVNPTDPVTVLGIMAQAPGYEPSDIEWFSYVNDTATADSIDAGPEVAAGLHTAPIVSVTTDARLSATTYGQARIDLIDIAGRPGFSEGVGVRKFGNSSLSLPKPSMRFKFSTDFGPSELVYPLFEGHGNDLITPAEIFNKLEARSFSADSFIHHNGEGYYLVNEFARETMLDLGTLAPHDRGVNLFLNGEFMGYYSLREFPDGHWHHQYHGGDLEDYEWWMLKFRSGEKHELNGGAGEAFPIIDDTHDYQQVKDLVDAQAIVDQVITVSFGAKFVMTEWRATGPSSPEHPSAMLFTHNDYDPFRLRQGVNLPELGTGTSLIERYAQDDEFTQIILDRTAAAFCASGAMTLPAMLDRLDNLIAQVAPSMPGEVERWNKGSVSRWETKVATLRQHIIDEHDTVLDAWRDQGWFAGCNRRPQSSMVPNLVDLAGQPVDVSIPASDPESGALDFAATGLPSGLNIDPGTGAVTGTPAVPGTNRVQVTVTDDDDAYTVVSFDWTILAGGDAADSERPALVLNEYNAVDGPAGWTGTDSALGVLSDNGGDWLELLVTRASDLRGWSVELYDRDRIGERLELTDRFVFSNAAVLADVAAGSLVTIAEDQPEDAGYHPAGGDWTIAANSSNLAAGSLLTDASRSDFDTNRHEMVVVIRDGAGHPIGSIAGETFAWRQSDNLGAAEVLALCATPSASITISPVSDYQASAVASSFGQGNACDGSSQQLWQLRNQSLGDVDGSGQADTADVVAILGAVVGQPPTRYSPDTGDLNQDGSTDLEDAMILARCLAGSRSTRCPS